MGESESHFEAEHLPELKRNYPVFRLMGSNLISFFGDQIYLIAIPLIVLSITGSPLSMGIVAALERLPVFFQPIAGVLADRLNRRKVLLVCDLGRAILVGVLGILFLSDSLLMWELYSGAFIIGLITQVYNTLQFAAIPQLVRKENLQMVNSINSGSLNMATFVAPGLGGVLISFYNPGYALMLNSLSFFVAFLAILSISIQVRTERKDQKQFLHEVKEGFQFVASMKPILFTNIAMLFSVFGTTLFLTMLVFHLKDTVALATTEIGWLLSFGGGSAIVGSLMSPWIRNYFSYQSILFVGGVIGGASIILFGLTSSFVILVLMNAVGIMAASVKSPCIITIRQILTPEHLLGRVQATSRFMTWVLMPLAAVLAGWSAHHLGTAAPIVIGGMVTILASFLYLHPALKNIDLSVK